MIEADIFTFRFQMIWEGQKELAHLPLSVCKVLLFLDGNKKMRHHPYGFDIYLVKTIRRMAQILWPSQKSWTLCSIKSLVDYGKIFCCLLRISSLYISFLEIISYHGFFFSIMYVHYLSSITSLITKMDMWIGVGLVRGSPSLERCAKCECQGLLRISIRITD